MKEEKADDWRETLKRGSEEEKALAVKEMVKQGLYVFGGHHTMTTLVKLSCHLLSTLPPPSRPSGIDGRLS